LPICSQRQSFGGAIRMIQYLFAALSSNENGRLGAASRMQAWLWTVGGVAGLWVGLCTGLNAQDTPDYFRQNCVNCHTIGGGRLTGPDLKNVAERKDAEWLINFMINPKQVIDGGDAYAQKLVEESRGVVMPTGPGMNRYRAEQILKLIQDESKLPESQFKGLKISTEPFTEQDRQAGQNLFTGLTSLKNGGAACNSCHAMHDLAALGGGRLGPDLTRVYERLKGRAAVAAWLSAPATETMQPIFRNHPLDPDEIHALTAYFEASAEQGEASRSQGRVAFLLLGLCLSAGLIFLCDALWRGRFHAVRRPLVHDGVEAVHTRFEHAVHAQETSPAADDSQESAAEAPHTHVTRGDA
ncbi:MAG: c-type cytochrome, partial [Planctomycetaceae bacterium]|nr:c-type cytochrome [Planctomycetaceae bacterium]